MANLGDVLNPTASWHRQPLGGGGGEVQIGLPLLPDRNFAVVCNPFPCHIGTSKLQEESKGALSQGRTQAEQLPADYFGDCPGDLLNVQPVGHDYVEEVRQRWQGVVRSGTRFIQALVLSCGI